MAWCVVLYRLIVRPNPSAAAACDRRLVLSNGTLVGDDSPPPGT